MTGNAEAPLMTIGAFARASRLSVKALRLYEQHGLLTPHHVDRHNGYRRYHPHQLDHARLIARLREIAMPLDVVAAVVGAEDQAEADRRLAFWWAGEEHTTQVRRALVHSLRASIHDDHLDHDVADDDSVTFSVAYRTVPAWLLLSWQHNVSVDRLPSFIGETITRLQPLSTAAAGTGTHPVIVIYHGRVNADSDGPVEVCLTLQPDASLDATRLPVGVNLRRQDRQRECFVTLTKQQLVHPDILAAHDQIATHVATDRETPAGPPREYYFTDIRTTSPNQPVCHAALPVT